MNTTSHDLGATLPSDPMRRIGIATSGLVILFLVADAVAQLFVIPPILASAVGIGYPVASSLWQALGSALLASTVLYALPRTSIFVQC